MGFNSGFKGLILGKSGRKQLYSETNFSAFWSFCLEFGDKSLVLKADNSTT